VELALNNILGCSKGLLIGSVDEQAGKTRKDFYAIIKKL
jgi:hypothetical protein